MKTGLTYSETNQATFSPEDNKIRLYVGRVPRAEYDLLRAEGWTSTPKQGCDFVAVWTPYRRDTALQYAGVILDEDQGPEERAADRAERFSGYLDKRLTEAGAHADRYEAGPQAHGFQNQARAERAAMRHNRIADRAGDAWSKAEYWQTRTAGVISHALYKSTPGVRMGRIKVIEAEQRKTTASRDVAAKKFRAWKAIAAMTDTAKQDETAREFAGMGYSHAEYEHPITGKKRCLWSHLSDEQNPISGAQAAAFYLESHVDPDSPEWDRTYTADWLNHYALRLAYENQMLEAAGGMAAFVEMVAGGWIGKHQIRKVNKSPATGRVVSVEVMGSHTGFTKESGYTERATRPCPVILNIERLKADTYRPPTAEDVAAMEAIKAAEKAKAPKKPECPLINPTDADAERLQALWNERAKAEHCESHKRRYGRDYAEEFKPSTVCRIPQAKYSEASKGSYARAETRGLCADGQLKDRASNCYMGEREKRDRQIGPALCQIRQTSGDGSDYGARRVIILTDKPQKPLPAAVWQLIPAQAELIKA